MVKHLFFLFAVLLLIVSVATAATDRLTQAVADSCLPEMCPTTKETLTFDVPASHLPPAHPVYLKRMSEPFVSPVLSISLRGPRDTRFWQLRTVTVLSPNGEGEIHVLIPFLIATGMSEVVVGNVGYGVLGRYGARDHPSADIALCGVLPNLPVSDTCVRGYHPSRFSPIDPRRNHIGGQDAAAILAVHQLVTSRAVSEELALEILVATFGQNNSDTAQLEQSLRREFRLQNDVFGSLRNAGDNEAFTSMSAFLNVATTLDSEGNKIEKASYWFPLLAKEITAKKATEKKKEVVEEELVESSSTVAVDDANNDEEDEF